MDSKQSSLLRCSCVRLSPLPLFAGGYKNPCVPEAPWPEAPVHLTAVCERRLDLPAELAFRC